jgi:hypothetical protein
LRNTSRGLWYCIINHSHDRFMFSLSLITLLYIAALVTFANLGAITGFVFLDFWGRLKFVLYFRTVEPDSEDWLTVNIALFIQNHWVNQFYFVHAFLGHNQSRWLGIHHHQQDQMGHTVECNSPM